MFLLTKVLYCSLQICLSCSFLFNLLLHDLISFHHRLSPGQVFLHESQALILLVEARQFIFNDCFNLFLKISPHNLTTATSVVVAS
jgi:hypothetical protein